MNYIALLSATIRLIDLHDSDRGYGESPNFTRESRTGQCDGAYLDIAILVIECLKRLDETAHQEYLPFSSILDALRQSWPQVNDSDVLYVINVLRRPTELFYLTRTSESPAPVRQSEKRKTALIEKTDYADEYRLSPTGRMLLLLATTARDAIYLRGDAYNLLHAIEGGDFPRVSQFSEEIIIQLRSEILAIRAALEKIGRTETSDKYANHFEQYRKVITETLATVRSAEEKLDSHTTLEEFGRWLDLCSADITFESLHHSVLRVRQVLEVFNRLVTELVATSSKDKRTAVPPPAFEAFACGLVRSPFKPSMEDFFLRQWGAVRLEAPFHSALDGLGAVQLRNPVERPAPMEFADEVIEPISRLGKLHFLDRHGQAISAALERGAVRLSDALERGWFMVGERFMLGDLVGVFVAPDSLAIGKEIEIRVSPGLVTRAMNDGDLLFSDLELSIKGNTRE